MKLSEIATFVEDKISSNRISLADYVTTDSLLPNKGGKALATNLPPVICSLTHFRKGDVLVANIRPYLKKVWLADKEGGCSSDVLVFRVKEGNKSSFLYAVMLQDRFFDYAMKGAKGSKMPRGDKDQIMRYELPTFSPQEQENIGNFVISITNKLWLNREINHNLEAMAKQLYDYWFMQFDFPDENGKPYKSSGGKIIWNEKLKREIPEGWHCFYLNEIEPNIVTGKTPSTTDETNFGGDIPFITIDDIRKSRFVFQTTRTLSEKGAYSQLRKYIPIGSLCCSCIGTVGLLGFVGKRGQTNQQINTVIFENEYNKEYLYLSLAVYFSYATAKVGNILPNMSKDDFCKIPLLYPTKALVMEYHQKVEHLFSQIECLIANIEGLTTQRNELLPLLMNGQASLQNCD